ncbi:MAG: glycogen debranching enzyme N-terminal domain-containing protein, partial [Phycisphaerales bacterium]
MIALPEQQDAVPTYVREGVLPAALSGTEWLLTNGLGGFAMGTALGLPTRRYHGLLVAALSPPVQREVMLHSIADTVVVDPGTAQEARVGLTPFAFRGGAVNPPPPAGLVRFEKGESCRWVYRLGAVELTKEVHLFRGRNAAAVSYTVRGGAAALELRPLVAMRDAHALLSAPGGDPPRPAGVTESGLTLVRGATRLELWGEGAAFRPDPQWWYGFEYAQERERGFDCHEDLFSPGVFVLDPVGAGGATAVIQAWVGERPPGIDADRRERAERWARVRRAVAAGVEKGSGADVDAVR